MPRKLGCSGRALMVGCWNIKHCRGLDDRVDIERTARVIRSLGAAAVGLQEVDRNWERSGRVDQPVRLAELTGLDVVFTPTLRRAGGDFGLALATRGPVDQHNLEILPREKGAEKRGVLIARWRGISILVTHLSLRDESRRLQTERLAELVGEVDPPVVLMGDMNQTRRHLGPLAGAGLLSPRGKALSHPAAFPYRQIDHILAGGGARPVSVKRVHTWASDHLPVVSPVCVDREEPVRPVK